MRYIFRRPRPEEFNEIRSQVPKLEAQLGAPAAALRRQVLVNYTPLRFAQYFFQTRKVGEARWIWVCPTIEFIAENEKGLFELIRKFSVPKPSHLAHLPD
jgi:hypothetical protein